MCVCVYFSRFIHIEYPPEKKNDGQKKMFVNIAKKYLLIVGAEIYNSHEYRRHRAAIRFSYLYSMCFHPYWLVPIMLSTTTLGLCHIYT